MPSSRICGDWASIAPRRAARRTPHPAARGASGEQPAPGKNSARAARNPVLYHRRLHQRRGAGAAGNSGGLL